MLTVGKTLKVHGLKGELKVQCFLDSPALFSKIEKISLLKQEYFIEKARVNGEFVLLKLKGVDDANKAQELCGAEIFAEKTELPPLPDGRFYIADLIGCVVQSNGERVGKIKDVLQYGSADVLVLTKEGKTIMLPWVKDLFATVSIDSKVIEADKKRLEEVAVYED